MDQLKRLMGIAVVAVLITLARSAQAAAPTVHLVGPAGLVRAGDTVSLEVRLDSGGQVINALDLHLAYSPLNLQLLRVDQAQSVWPLWPEQPRIDNQQGAVSLVAGRPHGLIAIDAPVATLIFRSQAAGLTQVGLDGKRSGVYLNDGRGTRLAVGSQIIDLELSDRLVPAITLDAATTPLPDVWSPVSEVHLRWSASAGTDYSYRWSDRPTDLPDDAPDRPTGRYDVTGLSDGVYFFSIKSRVNSGLWSFVSQYRFLIDGHPPAAFQLHLLTASQTDGTAALAWSTTDETSGIDHYELTINGRDTGRVISPLPLRPGWRGRDVVITAVDGAGNQQSADWHIVGLAWPWVAAGLGGLIAAAGLLRWWFKRRRR